MPDTPSRPAATLPNWLRVLLAILAVNQLALGAIMVGFMPPGWNTIFGLPPVVVQAVMLGAALLLLALGAWAWIRPQAPALTRLYALLQSLMTWRAALVLPLGLLLPAFALVPSHWAGHILLGVQCGLGALLLALAAPARATQDRWIVRGSLLVIALGVGFRVWLMMTGTFGDEGFFVSAALNMASGGGIAPAGIQLPDVMPHRPDWGWLLIVYGWWVRVFGTTLISIRALGLVTGLVALPFVYLLVRRWYGPRAAWITTAFAAISFMGLQTAAARNNALPMLAFAITLWLHVWARGQKKMLPHVLVGLAAALSLETHLVNLALLAAIGGVYAIDYIAGMRVDGRWQARRILRGDALWAFAAGVLPVMALYIYTHILRLPDPSAYLRYMAQYSTGGGLWQAVVTRVAGFVPHYKEVWLGSPVEAVLIAASLLAALWRRNESDRHWLLLVVLHEIAYLAVRPQGVTNIGYTSFAMPLLLAGSGALVSEPLTQKDPLRRVWTAAGAAFIAAALAGGSFRAIESIQGQREQIDATLAPITAAVRENIPAGEALIVPDIYVPYLMDYLTLFPPSMQETRIGPVLAEQNPESYWMGVYADLWPAAYLTSYHFAPPEGFTGDSLIGSYLLARQVEQIGGYVWAAPDDGLVTGADYAAPNGAALQMVAHVPPGEAIQPGAELAIPTVWITREDIDSDVQVTLSLVDAAGEAVISQAQTLTTAGSWQAHRFTRVALAVTLPDDVAEGIYTPRVAVSGALCAPGCIVDLDAVEILP